MVNLMHYVFNAQPRSCLLQYMENTQLSEQEGLLMEGAGRQ